MGRMLEALKQTDARPLPPVQAAQPCRPEAEPVEEEGEENATIPFIEVGGPRSELVASPDVLAALPSQAGLGPSPPQPAAPCPPSVPEAAITDVQGTIALWCSWTIRPGVLAADQSR